MPNKLIDLLTAIAESFSPGPAYEKPATPQYSSEPTPEQLLEDSGPISGPGIGGALTLLPAGRVAKGAATMARNLMSRMRGGTRMNPQRQAGYEDWLRSGGGVATGKPASVAGYQDWLRSGGGVATGGGKARLSREVQAWIDSETAKGVGKAFK